MSEQTSKVLWFCYEVASSVPQLNDISPILVFACWLSCWHFFFLLVLFCLQLLLFFPSRKLCRLLLLLLPFVHLLLVLLLPLQLQPPDVVQPPVDLRLVADEGLVLALQQLHFLNFVLDSGAVAIDAGGGLLGGFADKVALHFFYETLTACLHELLAEVDLDGRLVLINRLEWFPDELTLGYSGTLNLHMLFLLI